MGVGLPPEEGGGTAAFEYPLVSLSGSWVWACLLRRGAVRLRLSIHW